ncbi:MAG: pyruvate kinase [Archaeoglobaceae archaeon]
MKTKLIASLGPSSSSKETIASMLNEGIFGFRINLAHGSVENWLSLIEKIREAESKLGKLASIVIDIIGPSLRLGDFPETLRVSAGSIVEFCFSDCCWEKLRIPFPRPEIFGNVSIGDIMLLDDGRSRFKVVDVSEECIKAEALTNCELKSRKSVVFQGKSFDLPYLNAEDAENLRVLKKFADYVGASLVRSSEDIEALRRFLKDIGCDAMIMCKIETREAIENLNKIIDASDAVLVARGDLGMNFGLEEVPRLQKTIVEKSLEIGKPVVIATQILESMIDNPVPTRAEVSDVANAVMEGVDALMLTGETAVGKYPVEAVRWLRRIVERTEFYYTPLVNREQMAKSLKKRYAKGVVELAEDINGALAIYSMKGTTVFSIASLRPRINCYVAVPSEEVARKLLILWGINPKVLKADSYMEGLEKLYAYLMSSGSLVKGNIVVLTYGLKDREQIVKIRVVEDVSDS